jgi:hypothetical protein
MPFRLAERSTSTQHVNRSAGAGPVNSGQEVRMWQRLSIMLVCTSLSACAASPSTRPIIVSGAGRDVITAAEIVASRVTDAYQAVAQLRPEFLRRRAFSSIPAFAAPEVSVYVDELPFGTMDSLHGVPLERVRLIRYLSPADADLRWGGSHTAGAILVTTMK